MERTPSYAPMPSPVFSTSEPSRPDHALTRLERRKLEKASAALNIYDLGASANLISIFGTNRLGWIFPIGYPCVDSLCSTTARD